MEYQEKITDTLLKYGTEPKVPFGNVEVMTSEYLLPGSFLIPDLLPGLQQY